MFQSTYLYKVRQKLFKNSLLVIGFQSTYLYKVRLTAIAKQLLFPTFQSTYLYKVRLSWDNVTLYDHSFNPRTYIRYDMFIDDIRFHINVSIHVPI